MTKWGSFIYKFRYATLAIWIVLIAVFSFYGLKLPSVLGGNGFEYDGEYSATKKILEKDFNQEKSSIVVLFEKEDKVSDSEWKRYIETSLAHAEKLPYVKTVISPLQQEGMMKDDSAYGVIAFDKEAEGLGDVITKLKDKLKNKDGMKASLTGEPVIVKDLNEASQKDLAKAETIGLPIALIVLLLAFGGLIAAGIPILIGVVSILISMGIMYFLSFKVDLTIFILNIVPMIGLALSIDFALLFINRFKEEINNGKSIPESVGISVATAGRSIIFSGLCVFIGLSGLLFIEIDIFQNVAVGGMAVVFVSVLCALTFLPALLGILGKRINSLSVLKIKEGKSTPWGTFAKLVMRRPVIMAAAALAILIGGLIPVRDMHLAIPSTDALPPSYESREAFDKFDKEFVAKDKSDSNKVVVVTETKGSVLEEKNLKEISEFISELEKDKLVSSVDSVFTALGVEEPKAFLQAVNTGDQRLIQPLLGRYTAEDKMILNVYLDEKAEKDEKRDWVQTLSERKSDLTYHVGGQIKFEQEVFKEIFDKAPYGLALILISTFFILAAAFRSLLIPLKAIIMNILSLTATFGICVFVFEKGHFGMEPVDIALMLPVFVFSLVFGLSMDYEVFLISRIHEIYLETGDNAYATLQGLTSTSKIITSAAAIMIVVTGAFAFTGVMPVKQMGVGIAIAILIDATIVRMVLVPALMKLLGDWNWWFFGLKTKKGSRLKNVS